MAARISALFRSPEGAHLLIFYIPVPCCSKNPMLLLFLTTRSHRTVTTLTSEKLGELMVTSNISRVLPAVLPSGDGRRPHSMIEQAAGTDYLNAFSKAGTFSTSFSRGSLNSSSSVTKSDSC
jgi:hypothetical protein